MKKLIYPILILIVIIILIVLSINLANSQEAKEQLTTIQVSEVTHSVFYAPQYVAINQGFFEEVGLKIELTNGQGADKVMTAVLANQVDIGLAGPEATIYVYNEGKEDFAQVFAQLTKRDGSFLMGRTPEPNFEWSSLKGKHILPGRKGGVPYMTLQYVLNKNGVNPNTDLNFDDSIKFELMAGAFTGGTGDYVTIFEPTASSMEKEDKGYIVASVGEASGEIPYTAYFAKKSYINQNPEIIQKFVNAIAKGQKWIQEHTAKEIAEVIAPSFPDTDIDLLETVIQRYKEIDVWNATPKMNAESFELLQTVMIEAGELKQKAPYNELINNQFANQ